MNRTNHHPKTYTKRDVVKKVAAGTKTPAGPAAKWVDQVFAALRSIMMNGDRELRIEIRDFGVFEVKTTKAKPKARNPQSGEIIYVPARRKTHFKPGKLLKQYLSQPIEKIAGPSQ